ncbi:hypothetical protein [Pigmentiphaga humi]|uniref:hypothetical protein n=1 Tax=Pigmentiphaga humi TaxID=2478468 RepID=UPI000F54B0C1|nr:hypothetical protein [Pigmentiphaga humi]
MEVPYYNGKKACLASAHAKLRGRGDALAKPAFASAQGLLEPGTTAGVTGGIPELYDGWRLFCTTGLS